jgi:transposase
MINIFQPQLGNEELQAIDGVFKSNWIGKGKLTKEFEEKYRKKAQELLSLKEDIQLDRVAYIKDLLNLIEAYEDYIEELENSKDETYKELPKTREESAELKELLTKLEAKMR